MWIALVSKSSSESIRVMLVTVVRVVPVEVTVGMVETDVMVEVAVDADKVNVVSVEDECGVDVNVGVGAKLNGVFVVDVASGARVIVEVISLTDRRPMYTLVEEYLKCCTICLPSRFSPTRWRAWFPVLLDL